MKSIAFRKVKSGQVVINSPQEFPESPHPFVLSINAVYLTESESMIKPNGIACAKKDQGYLKSA